MLQAALTLSLHPKQELVLLSEANEILYGGAAGGGKSHLLRVLFILLCAEIAGFQAYLFRRNSNDLEKNHLDGPQGFRVLLAPWTSSGLATIVQGEIRFWNGSKIWLCHCNEENDIYKYSGAEMHALGIDEATQFTERMVRFLRSRLRIPGLKNIPAKWKIRLPLLFLSANPIGVGVEWARRWFITARSPVTAERMPDEEGGMLRQFIPARLDDNPSMTTDDPMYRAKLSGLGNAQLVRALLNGDWSAVEGAYFDNIGKIFIPPFPIPKFWTRFRSMDWGYARPFSVGWWAVSSGQLEQPDEPCIYRPGELIRYREWYGARAPNEGLRLEVPEVAQGIKERSGAEEIAYTVIDPSMFAKHGAPSIAETLYLNGISSIAGKNDRLLGWQQMRDRIKGYDDRSAIWAFNTCLDSYRTLPYLVHDDLKPEDLDTNGEDHAADDWRYGGMSRPFAAPVPTKPRPQGVTFNDLLESQRRFR